MLESDIYFLLGLAGIVCGGLIMLAIIINSGGR